MGNLFYDEPAGSVRTGKFKVGDRVVVLREARDEFDWGTVWDDSEDCAIEGRVIRLCGEEEDGPDRTLVVQFPGDTQYVQPEELEFVLENP